MPKKPTSAKKKDKRSKAEKSFWDNRRKSTSRELHNKQKKNERKSRSRAVDRVNKANARSKSVKRTTTTGELDKKLNKLPIEGAPVGFHRKRSKSLAAVDRLHPSVQLLNHNPKAKRVKMDRASLKQLFQLAKEQGSIEALVEADDRLASPKKNRNRANTTPANTGKNDDDDDDNEETIESEASTMNVSPEEMDEYMRANKPVGDASSVLQSLQGFKKMNSKSNLLSENDDDVIRPNGDNEIDDDDDDSDLLFPPENEKKQQQQIGEDISNYSEEEEIKPDSNIMSSNVDVEKNETIDNDVNSKKVDIKDYSSQLPKEDKAINNSIKEQSNNETEKGGCCIII